VKRLFLVLMLIAAPCFGATRTDTTVAFYHGAPDRAGNYIVPSLNWHSAASVHRVQEFDGKIDEHVYAQPLYLRSADAQHGVIVAATESDLVYALDAVTGHVVWRTALGHPVPSSALPCGNINPLGITGTPVIDASHGTVYLDAMIDDRGTPRHLLYGLRLSDGGVLPGFPIDVGAGLVGIRFDAAAQNQRIGASQGTHLRAVRRPFRRLQRLSWRVAVNVDPPQMMAAWLTHAAKGGIWAPAGLSETGGSARRSRASEQRMPDNLREEHT
jgi:PQQ enzyme repeat